MEKSIVVAYLLPPFQGDNNVFGRHKIHASIGFQSPFCCRPEKSVEKGGWKTYSYWPLVALTYTTSYRRSAFLGRQLSGRKRDTKAWIPKHIWGSNFTATSHFTARNSQ